MTARSFSLLHKLLVLQLLIAATICHADSHEVACASKIHECFSFSGVQRSVCFQVTSRLDLCLDTPVGALAARRGEFSSSAPFETPHGLETPPDPAIFDRECVANFDTMWLSYLVNEDSSLEIYENLHDMLKNCSPQPPFELLRP